MGRDYRQDYAKECIRQCIQELNERWQEEKKRLDSIMSILNEKLRWIDTNHPNNPLQDLVDELGTTRNRLHELQQSNEKLQSKLLEKEQRIIYMTEKQTEKKKESDLLYYERYLNGEYQENLQQKHDQCLNQLGMLKEERDSLKMAEKNLKYRLQSLEMFLSKNMLSQDAARQDNEFEDSFSMNKSFDFSKKKSVLLHTNIPTLHPPKFDIKLQDITYVEANDDERLQSSQYINECKASKERFIKAQGSQKIPDLSDYVLLNYNKLLHVFSPTKWVFHYQPLGRKSEQEKNLQRLLSLCNCRAFLLDSLEDKPNGINILLQIEEQSYQVTKIFASVRNENVTDWNTILIKEKKHSYESILEIYFSYVNSYHRKKERPRESYGYSQQVNMKEGSYFFNSSFVGSANGLGNSMLANSLTNGRGSAASSPAVRREGEQEEKDGNATSSVQGGGVVGNNNYNCLWRYHNNESIPLSFAKTMALVRILLDQFTQECISHFSQNHDNDFYSHFATYVFSWLQLFDVDISELERMENEKKFDVMEMLYNRKLEKMQTEVNNRGGNTKKKSSQDDNPIFIVRRSALFPSADSKAVGSPSFLDSSRFSTIHGNTKNAFDRTVNVHDMCPGLHFLISLMAYRARGGLETHMFCSFFFNEVPSDVLEYYLTARMREHCAGFIPSSLLMFVFLSHRVSLEEAIDCIQVLYSNKASKQVIQTYTKLITQFGENSEHIPNDPKHLQAGSAVPQDSEPSQFLQNNPVTSSSPPTTLISTHLLLRWITDEYRIERLKRLYVFQSLCSIALNTTMEENEQENEDILKYPSLSRTPRKSSLDHNSLVSTKHRGSIQSYKSFRRDSNSPPLSPFAAQDPPSSKKLISLSLEQASAIVQAICPIPIHWEGLDETMLLHKVYRQALVIGEGCVDSTSLFPALLQSGVWNLGVRSVFDRELHQFLIIRTVRNDSAQRLLLTVSLQLEEELSNFYTLHATTLRSTLMGFRRHYLLATGEIGGEKEDGEKAAEEKEGKEGREAREKNSVDITSTTAYIEGNCEDTTMSCPSLLTMMSQMLNVLRSVVMNSLEKELFYLLWKRSKRIYRVHTMADKMEVDQFYNNFLKTSNLILQLIQIHTERVYNIQQQYKQ